MKKLLVFPFIGAGLLSFFGVNAQATQKGLSLDYGLEYSDNIFGTAGDGEDDLSQIVGLNAFIENESRRLSYLVNTRIKYQEYENSALDDDLSLNGGLQGSLALIEKRLVWNLSNSATERRVNTSLFSSAGNSEWVNQFSTGPTWTLRLGDRGVLDLSADYSRTYYEITKQNELESMEWGAAYRYRLSKLTQLGLRASTTDIDRDLLGVEETRDTVSVFLNRQFKRSLLTLTFGQSTLESDTGGSNDFNIYAAEYVFKINKHLDVTFGYSRSVITEGESIAQRFASLLSDTNSESESQGGFEVRENASVELSGEHGNWSWMMRGYQVTLEDSNTEIETDNNSGLILGLNVKPSQRLNVGVQAKIEERETPGANADEAQFRLRGAYDLTRDLDVSLAVQNRTRDQEGPTGQSIDVNEVLVSLKYRF